MFNQNLRLVDKQKKIGREQCISTLVCIFKEWDREVFACAIFHYVDFVCHEKVLGLILDEHKGNLDQTVEAVSDRIATHQHTLRR